LSRSTTVLPPTRLEKDSGRLTVILPVRYESYIRVLLVVWLLAWGAMETVLIISLIDQLRGAAPQGATSGAVLAALLAFSTAAGAFMAWRLRWVSRGREILELTPDLLRLWREPGRRGVDEYARQSMRNLHIGSYSGDAIYPSWGRRFLGKEEAFIAFDYEGKTREIARGIPRKDAEYVLNLIRNASVRV